jgi:multidrug efflux system outer membrane protein
MMKRFIYTPLLLAGLLAGCKTVGTDYAGPPATPQGAGFVRAPAAAPDTKVLAHWWTALGDPVLDSLEQRALRASPNIAIAHARLRLARASLRGERAKRLPNGTATALAAHAHLPPLGDSLGGASLAGAEPLVSQLAGQRDALAVLLGQAPGTLDTELGQSAAGADAVPLPPASVAVGDPAQMLRRRPDIRAAERTLAARQAQVGQSEAARFPRLSLLGLIGIGGTHLRDLTHLDDYSAIVAPQLSWNVLDFGRVRAGIEQAEGVRDEAEAQYRLSVLNALRDAEDALSRFGQRRTTVATIARAKLTADRVAALTSARQKAGTASLIDVLDAERQQYAAEQNLAQAQAALTGDFIALHKALGLGWEDAPR